MLRPVLAFSAIVLGAVPAAASNYSGTPAAPAAGRFIAPDIVWNCSASICQGSTQESRPLVLCQSLAKRAGKIDTFLVDGRAFSEAELSRCNSAAKSAPAQSLAAQ